MLSSGFHCRENDGYAQDMLDSTNSDMNTIITGDESWVYGYDPDRR